MDEMTKQLMRLQPRIVAIGGGGSDGEDLFNDVFVACLEKEDRYD